MTATRRQPTTASYGLLAEFASGDALLAAVRKVRGAGPAHLEACTPFAVDGLAEALGVAETRVPAATLAGGLAGGLGAYLLQWYSAAIDYPIDVGGRPLHSWPMFIPVTFEMTVLGAAIAAVAALLVGARLPELAHPLFAAPDFDLASRDRFFLCVRSDDPRFDAAQARALLEALAPIRVSEVAA